MKLIAANTDKVGVIDDQADVTIFLAGPITNAPNWQGEFFEKLKKYQEEYPNRGTDNITVYSPRWIDNGKEFEFDMRKQYDWETYYLKACDIVVFGFVPYAETPSVDRSYARTTRIELGETIGRNTTLRDFEEDVHCSQDIFVYIDPEYTDDKDGYIRLKTSINGYIWSDEWETIFDRILNKTLRYRSEYTALKMQARGVEIDSYADTYNNK